MSDSLFEEYFEFVKSQQHKEHVTIGGRSSFSVRVNDDGFLFIPSSTRSPRKTTVSSVKKFFDRHRETGSYKTSDYSERSVNASYYLSLLKSFYSDERPIKEFTDINEPEAIEGYEFDKRYTIRARDRTLPELCKKRDKYKCQVCGFSLKVNGSYIIECHHKFPLSKSCETKTKLSDLVSLCPTCHRLAHLRNPPFSVLELKSIIENA